MDAKLLGSGEKDYIKDQQVAYVRKVFGIVAVQLVITFASCLWSSFTATPYEYNPPATYGNFVNTLAVQLTALFVMLFTMIALLCVPRLRKQVPVNYILLFIFTMSEALAVSAWTAYLTPESVLIAIGVLMASVVTLAFAALTTPMTAKLARNLIIGLIIGVFIQFFVVMTMCIFDLFSSYWYMLYGTLGMAISGVLIFVDVMMIQIMGKVAVDEYIYGAMLLYIDIIRLLLYILMIFGKGK